LSWSPLVADFDAFDDDGLNDLFISNRSPRAATTPTTSRDVRGARRTNRRRQMELLEKLGL